MAEEPKLIIDTDWKSQAQAEKDRSEETEKELLRHVINPYGGARRLFQFAAETGVLVHDSPDSFRLLLLMR